MKYRLLQFFRKDPYDDNDYDCDCDESIMFMILIMIMIMIKPLFQNISHITYLHL